MSTTRQSVLVLTAPVDPTADLVVLALQDRGVPVRRVDSATFPAAGAMSAEIGGNGDGWTVRLDDVVADDVATVYYRRPRPFVFAGAVENAHRAWCEGQARYGFWGVLRSLDVAWVNHPAAVGSAEYKPRQLSVARSVGLRVPATLITNDPSRVRDFARRQPHGTVTKALYARGPREADGAPAAVLYTTRVPADRLDDPSIALTMHLFQEFVPKAHDVRLTVVDGRLFAAAIEDSDHGNVDDWRRSHRGLSYRTCSVPPDVGYRVRTLVDELGLRFAAIDFLVTPESDWVFVEVNPNGQWAWIEHETGLPIADALADAMTPAISSSSATSWMRTR